MIKKFRRKNSGFMRRSSRIFLIDLNKNKTKKLTEFLQLYAQIVRYFIEMFWSTKSFSNSLAKKEITDKAVEKYGVTARLSQLAAKQAKEIILSQGKKSGCKKRMPKFKHISVNLDSRFFKLSEFNGSFDMALTLSSGFPKLTVPFNQTKHTNKFWGAGWVLSKSIRMGIQKKKIYIDLIYEKEKPKLKEIGEVTGCDLGYRVPIALSSGELIGEELKPKIVKSGKRRKSFHHYVQTELNRFVKQIDLSNIKVLVLEKLKNVKGYKRGKFSRKINRLLSFWHYARVINSLRLICEEFGIRMEFKSPWKTSQRCPVCGKIDRRNRRDTEFKCTRCDYKNHADTVGALNLKSLGLAGVYSLRLLPK